MTNQDWKQNIILIQRDAYRRHGYHPNSLLWSSHEAQEIRFQILAQIGIEAGDSVLDIGCGFGDFSGFLEKHDKAVEYTGIDLSEDLVQEGRKQFPDINLITTDLFEFDPKPNSYDYVTLSGTLNRKYSGSEEYALEVIQRMFETCRKGVAFNLLNARHEWTAGRWDLQSFVPDELLQELNIKTAKSEVIDQYLDNDFTVYLLKD